LTEKVKYYHANGKLLITGEYLILHGAEGLAVPLKYGQDMRISQLSSYDDIIVWEAYNPEGVWFKGIFSSHDFSLIEYSDKSFAVKLKDILEKVKFLNDDFPSGNSYKIITKLEFDHTFGFGSSSTLIVNLAKWANVNPFELQRLTFKGSGYDIACGLSSKPVIYKLEEEKPFYKSVYFDPAFLSHIYFVFLGKKQKSYDAIVDFNKNKRFSTRDIDEINKITKAIIKAKTLEDFEVLLREHEMIISSILKTKPVKDVLFKGYSGMVKSLGAWGGDFVLATSIKPEKAFREEMLSYGFNIVYNYRNLVLR
jgi:mevalonate kinase